MRINALLSGFSPVAVRGGENARLFSGGTAESARRDNGSADVFLQGQPWKNMAAASPAAVAGGKPCACKTCPACAAQAYAEQAVARKDIPVPGVAAAGKEEKAAEPSGASEGAKDAPVAKGQEGVEPVRERPQAAAGPKGANGEVLTQAERLQIAELEMIDTKVRAHELAHLAAAGSYATGGASFQYAKGPDGKQYAVGGEVGIDTGKESSPEATISKMQTVRAAALAPADPSPQDQKVAARASLVIAEASQELQMIRLEQVRGKTGDAAKVEAGLAGKPLPQAGEKAVASGSQQSKEDVAGQQPPGKAQQAASIMAGFMRPVSQIHIAV